MHVITGLGQGGAEAVLFRLMKANSDRRNFAVVSLGGAGVYGTKLQQLGVQVECLNITGIYSFLLGFFRLFRWLAKGEYSVVQTWMYHADLFGGLAASLARVPVVWGLHNSNFQKGYMKLSTRIVVRACAILSRFVPFMIVTCSKVARDLHMGAGYVGSEKFFVIPNGLDLTEFSPRLGDVRTLRGHFSIPDDALVFLNVARFDPQKDHENLIRAFSVAFRGRDDVYLILCGSGIDGHNEILARMVGKEGCGSRILLLGSRDDVPDVMKMADVFVLSSIGEAFPCVVAEAMASGIPCIVTDVGDCREMVGESGVVVQPSNSDELSVGMAKMAGLSQEERAELGRVARRIAVDRYSVSATRDSYWHVWQDSLC